MEDMYTLLNTCVQMCVFFFFVLAFKALFVCRDLSLRWF